MADLAAWHAQPREVRGLIISESSKVGYIRSIICWFSCLWKFYPALFTPEFVDSLDDKDTGPTRDEIKTFIDHPPSELNVKPIFFQHLKIEQHFTPWIMSLRNANGSQSKNADGHRSALKHLFRTFQELQTEKATADLTGFFFHHYDHYMSYLLCSNLHGICRCCYHFRDS